MAWWITRCEKEFLFPFYGLFLLILCLNQFIKLFQNKILIPNISKPNIKRKPTGVNGVMTESMPTITKVTPINFLTFLFSVQIFLKKSFIF